MQLADLFTGSYKARILIVVIMLIPEVVFPQAIRISGMVTDARTGESLPYVSVIFKRTSTGTTTDTTGYYSILKPPAGDTLRFSAIGYHPEEIMIPASSAPNTALSVRLKPETVDITEVTVTPDDGPVRRLLQHIIRNKPRNDPERLSQYAYRKYTKWEYRIDHVGDRLANSPFFRNHPEIFKAGPDSSRYLPFYFSEQIAYNEVQKNPSRQRSTVIADKTHGVGILEELRISGFTSALDMEVNYYTNVILLFEQNFISPVADNGWFLLQIFPCRQYGRRRAQAIPGQFPSPAFRGEYL